MNENIHAYPLKWPTQVPRSTSYQRGQFDGTPGRSAIDSAWREKAKTCHPDRPGGSHDAMTELNTARDQASQQATLP